MAAQCRRVWSIHGAARAGHPPRAASPLDPGRELRALPASDLSRPEALLGRRQRRGRADDRRVRPCGCRIRHARSRDRHGPPRPPERPHPCPRQALRGDHPGLRGQEEVEGGRRRSVQRQRSVRGFLGRRQVPPRRPAPAGRARDGGRGADGPRPESEPPRAGQPGHRGDGPRLAGHHRSAPASPDAIPRPASRSRSTAMPHSRARASWPRR